MTVKAYEPRKGIEELVVDGFTGAGEYFVVGDEEHPWPYATENSREQNFLSNHPQVKEAAVADAESHDPGSEAKVLEKEHNATAPAAALAVEEGVDLGEVSGSGADGKILLGDVERALADRKAGDEEEGGE